MTEVTITEKLGVDLKTALKAGEKEKVGVVRMLLSQLKNRKIEKGGDLSLEEEWEVLAKYAKQRLEAAGAAEKGGRTDMAEKERREHKLVSEYLPARMSEKEIEELTREIMAGQESPNLGSLMKEIMSRVKGKADGKDVKRVVDRMLSGG